MDEKKKKKCWVKRRERKTRSIRKADLVVCRNGGPPVTSGGIGVVGQRLATLGQGTLVPSFPSESSFITLTWETQRDSSHPCALMFSLSATTPPFFLSLFRRHSAILARLLFSTTSLDTHFFDFLDSLYDVALSNRAKRIRQNFLLLLI